MATREWTIDTTAVRSIRLEHGYWSGRVVIAVDGVTVFERPAKLFDFGLERAFTIDGIPCVVRIEPSLWRPGFSYHFLSNESPLEDAITGTFEHHMRRWYIFAMAIWMFAIYLVPYPFLSWSGEYQPSWSGRLRYSSGLSVTDMSIWQPRFAHWRPYVDLQGEHTSQGNLLGYFYSPLIRIDRGFFHPTHYYLEPPGAGDDS